MLERLSGATRVYVIVGDPIAQVKSPNGVTRLLEERGHDAVVVPAHVAPAELDAFVDGVGRMQNLDGIIVTVPHKIAMLRHCATVGDTARFVGAVNVIRRTGAGWHGDMLDGIGCVTAQQDKGCRHESRRALLVGAGGAGSAIALALLEAGVSELAVADVDPARRDTLLRRLGERYPHVAAGSDDPAGFDIVANATPSGMRPGDTPPVRLDRLQPSMFASDVVTAPEITPLLEAARAKGCGTSTGLDMFHAQLGLMVDFLTAA